MREAHVEVKMVKPPQARRAFGTRAAGNARGCGRKHISKAKMRKAHQVWTTFGFFWTVQLFKKDAGVGRLKKICRCILRGKHRARDISIRHVKRSGR